MRRPGPAVPASEAEAAKAKQLFYGHRSSRNADMHIRFSPYRCLLCCSRLRGDNLQETSSRETTNHLQLLPATPKTFCLHCRLWAKVTAIFCNYLSRDESFTFDLWWDDMGESWCCANIQTNQAAKANFTSETDKKHQNAIYERWGIVEYALFYRWGGLQCWSVKLWDVTSRF